LRLNTLGCKTGAAEIKIVADKHPPSLVFARKQAEALGLPCSTTWTILRATHKSSGLSAAIIKKNLASPTPRPNVRARILGYASEKLPVSTVRGSKTGLDFLLSFPVKRQLVMQSAAGERAAL
jgi:hypothetical protein